MEAGHAHPTEEIHLREVSSLGLGLLSEVCRMSSFLRELDSQLERS